MTRPRVTLLAFCAALGGCPGGAPRPSEPAPAPSVADLRLDPETVASLDPDLRATLRDDPHHYFRYVANRFVGLECETSDEGPTVNLHGDAHVEQYLVTSLGRGLGDFDEATTGPAAIDLVRLATSIRIAARMRSWDPEVLWSRFLDGYLHALRDPAFVAPEPAFATRTRADFTDDHGALLTSCDALFTPMTPQRAAEVEVALQGYVEMLTRHRPELDPHNFDVVRIGPHRLGVGSRRASNFLIRVRGPTDDPDDDLILEAKEVTRNPLARCLPISRRADALRILVADARLAYAPFRDVGFVEIDGRPFWIHEWVNDYEELDVSDASLTEHDLTQVLFDVGVQLGLGHPRGLGDPYEGELRNALSRFVVRRAGPLWTDSEALAEAVLAGWESVR